MKTRFGLIIVGIVFIGALRFSFAQCPEICDASDNTGLGNSALISTIGTDNTGLGFFALGNNTAGFQNTATGSNALVGNSTGTNNTATGFKALGQNTTASGNTAVGAMALRFNTIGGSNTGIGNNALLNATGSTNIALGAFAGSAITTGDNNIEIGNSGASDDGNRIRIGTRGKQHTVFIAGISGVTIPNGVGVLVNAQGQLGTLTSSAHYKEAIKPMDNASEAILSLKPVTFRYKHELDPAGIPQFGLVAEEVAKVDPDLVAKDDEGKPYSVRYEAVNAMLLNEFLKEHNAVEELKATVAKQREEISELVAAIKEHRENAP